jgi:hypothetical protein
MSSYGAKGTRTPNNRLQRTVRFWRVCQAFLPAGIEARDKGAEAVNRILGACLNSLSAAHQATLSRILDQWQPRTSKTKRAST